jgi:hypothetical protein
LFDYYEMFPGIYYFYSHPSAVSISIKGRQRTWP